METVLSTKIILEVDTFCLYKCPIVNIIVRSMSEIIKTENLKFEYAREDENEEIQALHDVSLNIEKGSFTAVIGRNGSGKSTLAKNINALLLPTEGRVVVAGFDTKDEEHVWDIRQRAGMVFQNPDNQLVSAIVEDDVAFGPENLGIPRDEIKMRVEESLYAVDMWEERKKAPHLLSGGQKQRIAIAGVVAMKPECIIFDEPTAMLDPEGRREVMDILKKLNAEGITVILITHFMDEAASADRLIIMDAGEVVIDDTPRRAFREADKIQALGLELPFTIELARKLRERGADIPENILHREELIGALCRR